GAQRPVEEMSHGTLRNGDYRLPCDSAQPAEMPSVAQFEEIFCSVSPRITWGQPPPPAVQSSEARLPLPGAAPRGALLRRTAGDGFPQVVRGCYGCSLRRRNAAPRAPPSPEKITKAIRAPIKAVVSSKTIPSGDLKNSRACCVCGSGL